MNTSKIVIHGNEWEQSDVQESVKFCLTKTGFVNDGQKIPKLNRPKFIRTTTAKFAGGNYLKQMKKNIQLVTPTAIVGFVANAFTNLLSQK
jgi:hypothetical protein